MSETIQIYNRPATVEKILETVAQVRYQDNGTRGYVPVEMVISRKPDTDTGATNAGAISYD